MLVPFFPFPMTWGEAAMVVFVAYFMLRDTITATARTRERRNRRRFWQKELAHMRGHDARP